MDTSPNISPTRDGMEAYRMPFTANQAFKDPLTISEAEGGQVFTTLRRAILKTR